jgi:putative copper export protein/methionine-rich copper-binding protein CopC
MTATVGKRLAVGGAVSLVAIVLMAGPAAAHTKLDVSSPEAGATVTDLTRIELRFTEAIEVSASHVWISDAAGYMELAGVSAIDDGSSLTVPVPALGEGTYEVTWHVVAADGDPVQGTFPVTVAAAPVAAVVPASLDPAADPPPDASLAIPLSSVRNLDPPPELGEHGHGPGDVTKSLARGVLDGSLAILVGGLGFVALVWPRGAALLRTRQVLWGSGGVAAVASLELTAFQHAGATGISTFAALTPAQQLASLDFHFGRVGAVRVLLIVAVLGLVATLVRRANRPTPSTMWIAGAVLLAIALAETMVLLGQSTSVASLGGVARLTHVIGISAWIGGLVMLLAVALPRRRAAELVELLPRFSRFATAAIAVLMVGGVLLAVDHLGSVGALTGSDYGRVLVAKLVVVGLVLVVATLSRAHVRACLRAPARLDGVALARPLVMWAGIEVGLLTAVMAITAVLVGRVPPA